MDNHRRRSSSSALVHPQERPKQPLDHQLTKIVKHRGQKFVNDELRTVVSIDDGKIIFDKGEIVRNGVVLPLDQGIAVTSHASQAKTVEGRFWLQLPYFSKPLL
jgi:hypothetical protein